MKQVLKVYDVKLTVDGPVHIGNGREIEKKEYVYLSGEKKIVVLDPSKLSWLLSKRDLIKAYERFQLGSSKDDIGKWLEKSCVSAKEYLKCAKYQLDCGDSVADSLSKLKIQEFIKDAYGMPYVPGSSIKGMLRTILLAYNIKENPKKYEIIKRDIREQIAKSKNQGKKGTNRNNFLKNESSILEKKYYQTLQRPHTNEQNAVNDILAGIIVGDSKPLSVDDLILCQQTGLHLDGEEKKINVLREALRPGTVVSFQLTIDTELCAITKEYLENAIAYFSRMHDKCFLQKFQKDFLPLDNTVWLGGGSGFVTKTEVYPLFGDAEGVDITVGIFKGIGVDPNHNHDLDQKVSPHVCKVTRYQGKQYLMGTCLIDIVERSS